MPFTLHPVLNDRPTFTRLIRLLWLSFSNPPQPIFSIFCPSNPPGAKTREDAIRESTDRYWEWTRHPDYQWWMVVDEQSGGIVGGALWKFELGEKGNGKGSGSEAENGEEGNEVESSDAYWHPEGSQREFASQVIDFHGRVRARLATRPYLYLNIIFVRPDYQRHGIGRMLMDWGVQKADEKGLEMWLEGSRYGRQMYERCGFVVVDQHCVKPVKDKEKGEEDEVWRRCEREWADLEEWVMWRPEGGFVEGMVKPWEVGSAGS